MVRFEPRFYDWNALTMLYQIAICQIAAVELILLAKLAVWKRMIRLDTKFKRMISGWS